MNNKDHLVGQLTNGLHTSLYFVCSLSVISKVVGGVCVLYFVFFVFALFHIEGGRKCVCVNGKHYTIATQWLAGH